MPDRHAASPPARKYRAFISYCHADAPVAHWLHERLERWKLPGGVQVSAHHAARKRPFFPTFIDERELSGSPSLRQALIEALDQSEALVLLCSPDSARSTAVNEEVGHFSRTRQGRRLITVLVGERVHPVEACFCPALPREDGLPLAIDLRVGATLDRRDALLKLLAALLGVGFDQLKRRERQRQRRRWAALAAGSCAMVVWGVMTYQAEQLRQADEALAIADERFGRLDYEEGSVWLQSSLDGYARTWRSPTRKHLALVYRTLLAKRISLPFAEIADVEALYELYPTSRFLALLDTGRLALIDATHATAPVYLDVAALRQHFKAGDLSTSNLKVALYSGVEADLQQRRLYVLLHAQLLTFDLDDGHLIERAELVQEPAFASAAKDGQVNFSLSSLAGQLLVEFGSASRSLALRDESGGWRTLQGRSIADSNEATGDLFLNDRGQFLERYRHGQRVARVPMVMNQDFVMGQRDGLLSVLKHSESGTAIEVLDGESLTLRWRCPIVSGRVLQAEPLGIDQLLVQTDAPEVLWLYRRAGQGCQQVMGYPNPGNWFDYLPERRQVYLSHAGGSEWLDVSSAGFEKVAQAAYGNVVVTPEGGIHALRDRRLIAVQLYGEFFEASIRGRYRLAGDGALVFSTDTGLRALTLSGSEPRADSWVRSSDDKRYVHVNGQGEVLGEIDPLIDAATIETLLDRAGFEPRNLLGWSIRRRGIFWHAPLHAEPWKGGLYGEAFNVLTRIDVDSGRLQVVPAPVGKHSLNVVGGEIWTRAWAEGSALSHMAIGATRANVVDGSAAFFALDSGESPWSGASGLLFSPDGHAALAYNSAGRWATVQHHRLRPPSTSHGLLIVDAIAQPASWVVVSRDKRLVRLSSDGDRLLQQAPLRPGAKGLVDLSAQGLFALQTDEGIALHDAETLAEVALLPGYRSFHATGAGQQILLAAGRSEWGEQWHIYRLPAFGEPLLERLSELRLAR